jgi:hypothetical protein
VTAELAEIAEKRKVITEDPEDTETLAHELSALCG